MRATIQKLNLELPYCEAKSSNDILFVFRPPSSGLHPGDVIEFDHQVLERPQTIQNISTGTAFTAEFREQDIHDLRLPAIHGSSRFPASGRFNES
jgi:hypothetical protein